MRALSPLLRSLSVVSLSCGCTLLAPERDEIYGAAGAAGASGGSGGQAGACALQASACVREIHAGMAHTCALRASDGAVFCWGKDDTGAASGVPGGVVAQPTRVDGIPEAARLATGSAHSCILTAGLPSELWCWPAESGSGPAQPIRAPNAQTFDDGVDVGVGDLSFSLLQENGAIDTWVVGDPVTQKHASEAAEIRAGTDQSCARDGDGFVSCWDFYAGSFPFAPKRLDELGAVSVLAGAPTGDALLQNVDDLASIPELARTPHCVASASGIQCFRGQSGTIEQRTIASGSFAAIGPGMLHGCALRADCSLACWGANHAGQLGTGAGVDTGFVDHPLSDVTDLADVAGVTAGAEHSCALGRDGSIWCWGKNGDGQLGVTGTPASDVPVALDMTSICP